MQLTSTYIPHRWMGTDLLGNQLRMWNMKHLRNCLMYKRHKNTREHRRTRQTKSVPWHHIIDSKSLKPDEKRLKAFNFDQIVFVHSKVASKSQISPIYSS
jgi:hypothetical protein